MDKSSLKTLILALLIGSISAYISAQLYRRWVLEDAAREREKFDRHAENVLGALENLYVQDTN